MLLLCKSFRLVVFNIQVFVRTEQCDTAIQDQQTNQLDKNPCTYDSLYRAVNFGYGYASTWTTFTATTIITIPAISTSNIFDKRQWIPPTAASSDISSACSCVLGSILFATAHSTTIIVPQTITTSTTTKPSPTATTTQSCPSSPIQNPGFESGVLAPWYARVLTANDTASISAPGSFNSSKFALNIQTYGPTYIPPNSTDWQYSRVTLGQNLTLCLGVTYNFTLDYQMTDTPSLFNGDIEWADGSSDPFISIGFGSGKNCNLAFCVGPFPPLLGTWYTQVGSFVAKSSRAVVVLDFAMAGTESEAFVLVDNVVFAPVGKAQ
ncbi:hypothetical protein N431DRAFT_564052 [Stipitochalara longipes BDJ]|nr:hypothetical protein N431DRAFT_564052 [Stipitochalara longipes BDJ]